MPLSLKKMILLPRPRRVIPKAGSLVLPATGRIVCATDAAQLLPLALQVQEELAHQIHWELGAGPGGAVRIVLRPGLPAQGYRLDISEKGVDLVAALGDAYLCTGHQPHNSSPLFHLLQRPATQQLHRAVTEKRLEATREYIEESAAPLALARMEGAEGALVRDEYANTVRLLRHACQRGLALRQGVLGRSAVKRRLAEDMSVILGEHRRLWTARNREGGLQDSARRLEARLAEYTS